MAINQLQRDIILPLIQQDILWITFLKVLDGQCHEFLNWEFYVCYKYWQILRSKREWWGFGGHRTNDTDVWYVLSEVCQVEVKNNITSCFMLGSYPFELFAIICQLLHMDILVVCLYCKMYCWLLCFGVAEFLYAFLISKLGSFFKYVLALYRIPGAPPIKYPDNVGGGGGSVGILTITWDVSI